jgi:hypothetical protein
MGDILTAGAEVTEKQLETIEELLIKAKAKGLTDNQRKQLAELCDKRDNPELGEVTKKRLIKVFAKEMYGREDDINSKYMEKGKAIEEDSISLFSRVKGRFYKKNDVRITNRYVSGEPDLSDTETDNIQDAEEIIDIKSSWSLITFLNSKLDKKVNSNYRWQGLTYLALVPKAKQFRLVYVLVNSPAFIIDDEKRKLAWTMREISSDSVNPEYIAACCQLEKNHIFDMALFVKQNPGYNFHNTEWNNEWDIPMKDRVHEFLIMRDEQAIDKMYKKIVRCRKYLQETFGQ